jgi:DNA-binding response OmpR family regulator
MRILIVEDELMLSKAVAETLRKQHYLTDLATDGESGLDLALSGLYDAIILDIMLPKMDGLAVLEALRGGGIVCPVLLLTARSRVEDRVRGLDLGADDYLTKPFHSDELLARLRALTRRGGELRADGAMHFGDFTLTPRTLSLKCGDREARLTPKEMQLLEYLIQNGDRILSKDSILEKIWGYDSEAEHNHVEAHVSLLRKKLAGIGSRSAVRTIRGVGYTLAE